MSLAPDRRKGVGFPADMDLQLQGRTALVSGGARGIGAATVRMLAAEGARVAWVDRDVEAGEALQSRSPGTLLGGGSFRRRSVQPRRGRHR